MIVVGAQLQHRRDVRNLVLKMIRLNEHPAQISNLRGWYLGFCVSKYVCASESYLEGSVSHFSFSFCARWCSLIKEVRGGQHVTSCPVTVSAEQGWRVVVKHHREGVCQAVASQKCCVAAGTDYLLLMWESFDGFSVLMAASAC